MEDVISNQTHIESTLNMNNMIVYIDSFFYVGNNLDGWVIYSSSGQLKNTNVKKYIEIKDNSFHVVKTINYNK